MEMKKVLTLVAAAGIIASASTSFALIKGGKHDMTAGGSATVGSKGTSTQLCIYCHTPHNAAAVLPLWNRNLIDGSGFKLYSNAGMANQMFSTGFTSDSASLFCMSCHDGATPVNNVAHDNVKTEGATLTLTSGTVGGSGNFSTDLSNSITNGALGKVTHPINFPVTSNSQNDLWIGPLTPGLMGTDNNLGTPEALLTVVGLPLFASERTAGGTAKTSLECSSCHSVHNYDNSPFLRFTMAGSTLCLGCHNK